MYRFKFVFVVLLISMFLLSATGVFAQEISVEKEKQDFLTIIAINRTEDQKYVYHFILHNTTLNTVGYFQNVNITITDAANQTYKKWISDPELFNTILKPGEVRYVKVTGSADSDVIDFSKGQVKFTYIYDLIETDSFTPTQEISLFINSNGEEPKLVNFSDNNGKGAVILKSKLLIPASLLKDEMGMNIAWNGVERAVTISSSNNTSDELTLKIDSPIATFADGSTFEMDSSAKIINGKTYIPVRLLAEVYGSRIYFSEKNNILSILMPSQGQS